MVMMTVVLVMCMCVRGAIFNIVQYVLYALSAIYVLVTVVCVRGMHKVMNQQQHVTLTYSYYCIP